MTASVVGVDGTRDGWLAVEVRSNGGLAAEVASDVTAVLERHPDAGVVAIDIPIGTPLPSEYPRAADRLARKMLGSLWHSVFFVPPREVLAAESYVEAISRCHELSVSGVSKQAFALAPKILEVEPFAADPRVREIHPEISFAAMAGAALGHTKKSWHGFEERFELLRAAGWDPRTIEGTLGRASVDDVLDAMAAAWTARRIAEGSALSLPPGAAPNSPAIWY